MPLMKLQTNIDIELAQQAGFLKQASVMTASVLGKPEDYVMVVVEPGQAMLFAGTTAPLAYVEFKSIGLPEARTAEFSAAICSLIHATFGIEKNRIYIEFSDAPRTMWGWDGSTF